MNSRQRFDHRSEIILKPADRVCGDASLFGGGGDDEGGGGNVANDDGDDGDPPDEGEEPVESQLGVPATVRRSLFLYHSTYAPRAFGVISGDEFNPRSSKATESGNAAAAAPLACRSPFVA